MAFIGNMIDPNAQPSQDMGAIPAGEYVAQIVDSNVLPTKTNDGQFLELVYRITEGPFTGRQVWARLNIDNPNAKTVAIANEQLAAIRVACGLQAITDSMQLHNIPHVIRVDFTPAGHVDKRGYRQERDRNDVKAWKRIEGAAPAAAAPAGYAQAAGQQPQPAPAGKPTWAQGPQAPQQ